VRRASIGRGWAIVLAFALALVAHRSRAQLPWGGLTVVERGSGTCAVVLLHGYGSAPDDLVPFADALAAQVPARFVVPAAPLPFRGGPPGRVWFDQHEADVRDQIRAARAAVDGVIDTVRARGATRVIVGGFSQGAILSIDMALAGHSHLDGIAVLSGRALGHPRASYRRLAHLPIFQSHGVADPMVLYSRGETFAARAREAGAELRFERFEGVHEIPPAIEAALAAWLRDVCAR
jgi:phospholipase/carboxylesterase